MRPIAIFVIKLSIAAALICTPLGAQVWAADTVPASNKQSAVKKDADQKNKSEKTDTVKQAAQKSKKQSVDAEKSKSPAKPVLANADLLDILGKNAELKTMYNLLEASGLAENLKSSSPFTVFAPNNAAFAKLPEGTLQEWLKPKNKSILRNVLNYHLVPGKMSAADFAGKQMNQNTVSGGSVEINATKADSVMINKSKMLNSEIAATNGTIIILDAVLQPSGSRYAPSSSQSRSSDSM